MSKLEDSCIYFYYWFYIFLYSSYLLYHFTNSRHKFIYSYSSKFIPPRLLQLILDSAVPSNPMNIMSYHNRNSTYLCCRPYFAEYPGSHLNSEGKQRKARLVLDLGTVRESLRVLTAFDISGFEYRRYTTRQIYIS